MHSFAKPVGEPLTLARAEAPAAVLARFPQQELAAWAASAHAETGVNCAACHAPRAKDEAALAAEWSDAFDLKASAQAARATLEAALERRETRGCHNRSDYPEMDPQLQVNLVWSPTAGVVREEIPEVPAEISALFKEVSLQGKLVE